jgi:hypothetical protein
VHMLSRPKELSTARSCGTREISFDKIFFGQNFMTTLLNAAMSMLLWYIYAAQELLYRCIGASDKIFDHFILLSSEPTTPENPISRCPIF